MDKLQLFLGLPVSTEIGIKLVSPTIRSIANIGEGLYHYYLSLATFNKDSLLQALFKPSMKEMQEISTFDDYQFLVSTPLVPEIEKALAFFTNAKVVFNESVFEHDGIPFLTPDNYKTFSRTIQELNGLHEKESEKGKLKFRNKKTEELYYLQQELERKYNSTDSLSLKDICSILCNAEGNGITVFNIGDLTIYQVYEHFERLSVKESHRRMLQVWANGHLKEDVKLQEWLIKTKL